MRKNDAYIFSDRAYQVADHPDPKTGEVVLRMTAGPSTEPRKLVVQAALLSGRTVYRPVPAIDDVDLDHAVEEITGEFDVETFGHDPRKWTTAFCNRFGSRPTPDQTIMLGWIAACIEAGVEAGREQANGEHKRRSIIAKKAADKRRNELKKKKTTVRSGRTPK